MDRVAYNALLAQYATPEVSGNGRVSWDGGVRCVMPSVKLYGKCEQETLTGKNLFHADWIVEQINAGSFATDGVAYEKTVEIPIENGAYMLKVHNRISGKGVCILSTNKAVNSSAAVAVGLSETFSDYKTVTVENGALYIGCNSTVENFIYLVQNCMVQIEAGTEATAYEPYCGGIPAPNPSYPMPVKCNNGKIICHGNTVLSNSNLFSGDFEWIQNTEKLWGLSEFYKYTILHLKPNTQYTIITPFGVYGKSKGFSSIYTSLNKNPVYHTYIQNAPGLCSQVTTLSTDDSGDVYLTYYGTSDPSVECVYREAYVVEGLCGQATAPELYAIPGTEYLDEWNPQTGWGVRRVKKLVLDGTENWKYSKKGDYKICIYAKAYMPALNATNGNAMCSHFSEISYAYATNLTGEIAYKCGIALANTTGYIYMSLPLSLLDTPDLDGAKDYLAKQYTNGTPVTLFATQDPEPFYIDPARLTQPNGPGQIIQVGGDVADCPITARYLTHS